MILNFCHYILNLFQRTYVVADFKTLPFRDNVVLYYAKSNLTVVWVWVGPEVRSMAWFWTQWLLLLFVFLAHTCIFYAHCRTSFEYSRLVNIKRKAVTILLSICAQVWLSCFELLRGAMIYQHLSYSWKRSRQGLGVLTCLINVETLWVHNTKM